MTDEFWHHYLRAHSKPVTRAFHYAGSIASVACLFRARKPSDLLIVPISGYLPAWTAHLFIERNRPETFSHPILSLLADYRMLYLAATRKLADHLQRAGAKRAGASPSQEESGR